MIEKLKELDKKLKNKFFFNFNMSNLTWFKAGGNAEFYCIAHNEYELQIILREIQGENYEIIGAGSNILIRDGGYKGLIIKLGKLFNKLIIEGNNIVAGASILDVTLSKFALTNSIKNFEFYSGIPGTVGGAIKMNAGCFGGQTKDVLVSIKTINDKGEILNIKKEDLKLSYRHSKLNKNNVVISANFIIESGDKLEIENKMNEIKKVRKENQPIQTRTSGSTFKNPKDRYAAELIDKAGCKNMNIGGVIVSNKHANFLINNDGASATQIEDLGKLIIEKVYNKYNILLEWEVKIIGNS